MVVVVMLLLLQQSCRFDLVSLSLQLTTLPRLVFPLFLLLTLLKGKSQHSAWKMPMWGLTSAADNDWGVLVMVASVTFTAPICVHSFVLSWLSMSWSCAVLYRTVPDSFQCPVGTDSGWLFSGMAGLPFVAGRSLLVIYCLLPFLLLFLLFLLFISPFPFLPYFLWSPLL